MTDLQSTADTCQAPLCQRVITDRSPSRDFCSDTCANAWWHDRNLRQPALVEPWRLNGPWQMYPDPAPPIPVEPFASAAEWGAEVETEVQPGFLWRALVRLGLVQR